MSIVQEFKDFINKGNMIDLAVAVVMGAAFKPVISALVDNIIMPPIGLALGGVDFKDLAFNLPGSKEGAEVVIGYGIFIQSVVDFLIIGFCVFLVVKAYNSMQNKEEAKPEEPAAPSEEVVLLTEIRDALKKQTANV